MTEIDAAQRSGDEGDSGDDLFNEFSRLAAVWNLTPTECRAVEEAIPGCEPGDIYTGNVRVQVIRRRLRYGTNEAVWPANEIEVGFTHPETGNWEYIRIEFLERKDISRLAKAFLWLLEHDDAEGGEDDA